MSSRPEDFPSEFEKHAGLWRLRAENAEMIERGARRLGASPDAARYLGELYRSGDPESERRAWEMLLELAFPEVWIGEAGGWS